MVNQIIWTTLHSGDMVDCTLRKTILTNPPVDPEACLLQLLQCSPPEEFLNLLLNGVITPTHTNWITVDHKKFTQTDFSQLLSKCEAPRILAEIARILRLDDLSAKVPHFVTGMNMSVHMTTIEDTSSQDLTAYPPLDTAYRLYCEENSPRNLTAYPAIDTAYPLHCEISANATKLSSAPALARFIPT